MENPFHLSFVELMAAMDYYEYRAQWIGRKRQALVAKGGWSAADETAANHLDSSAKEIAAYLEDCREALTGF